MQTPGSQITPMSQMVDSPAKRMNAAYEKLLRREQDDSEGKGATVRALGSLLVSFEKVNSEMKVIRRDIRRDLREKRKYHSAETKLLKKEKQALEGLQSSVTNFRRIIGAAAFALAAKNVSEGDFGNAIGNTGAGIAAFLPEIAEGVVGLLALKGLFGGGGRGKGNVPITGNSSRGLLSKIPKSGMGKWGALGLTALSLLTLPSLLGGNANAQQVVSGESRRERVIAGEQPDIINRRDTNRFSVQLDKFDAILRSLSGDDKGDVKPKDKISKIPEITTSGNPIDYSGDWKDLNSSNSSSDSSDNSSSDSSRVSIKSTRNWAQRFFDPGQAFSQDSDVNDSDGVYTGGRSRVARILDPWQIWTKDTKKKVQPKTPLLNQDDLLNLWLLNNNNSGKSLITGQEFSEMDENFLKGFTSYTENSEFPLTGFEQQFTKPEINNNGGKIINLGDIDNQGNYTFYTGDGLEVDPNGPQSFSPFILNNNSADSQLIHVNPKFYLSQDKFTYNLIRGQSSGMGD